MDSSLLDAIVDEAAVEEKRSRARARTAHVTHYSAGLGAAVSATLAGYLANVEGGTAWATLAGGLGAALAAVVTFMNPRQRAAFQYDQSADYGALKRDGQRESARVDGPREAEAAALSQRLTDLRRNVARDLMGPRPEPPSGRGAPDRLS